jgi:hypothetical protein
VLALTTPMYQKFLAELFASSPAERPLWSLKSDSFYSKSLFEGRLKNNRPIWSVVTKKVDAVKNFLRFDSVIQG